MKHTNETHPVPLNKREWKPCGCMDERRADGERWFYVNFRAPNCSDAKKIGRHRPGWLEMPMDATESDIERAFSATNRRAAS